MNNYFETSGQRSEYSLSQANSGSTPPDMPKFPETNIFNLLDRLLAANNELEDLIGRFDGLLDNIFQPVPLETKSPAVDWAVDHSIEVSILKYERLIMRLRSTMNRMG